MVLLNKMLLKIDVAIPLHFFVNCWLKSMGNAPGASWANSFKPPSQILNKEPLKTIRALVGIPLKFLDMWRKLSRLCRKWPSFGTFRLLERSSNANSSMLPLQLTSHTAIGITPAIATPALPSAIEPFPKRPLGLASWAGEVVSHPNAPTSSVCSCSRRLVNFLGHVCTRATV